ncbi:MAG: SpoIID/LytB domain-containing protein [Bacteroidales bacterium]
MKTTPDIHVGILQAKKIRFELSGKFTSATSLRPIQGAFEARLAEGSIHVYQDGVTLGSREEFIFYPSQAGEATFVIRDVVIGIGFHWEQKEDQAFQGALKLLILEGTIQVVNVVSVETYLESVISSEMRADSSPALLRAHTVISRSWLLAQIHKQESLAREQTAYSLVHEDEHSYIRWYDREDHRLFHVCADDHCQRYQGITRAHNPAVVEAVRSTRGEVLMYGQAICDARFSKCCGGVSEVFEACWEPVRHGYLQRIDDNPADRPVNTADLRVEETADAFIRSSPEAFCNTRDGRLLSQVLNDYDQSSPDFYRWELEYTQDEISALIREKSGRDFGDILDLVPVERGESGRLIRLKIVGSKQTLTVGKELEIRRWLSKSHLYSSAFVVTPLDRNGGIPARFHFRGAGWGHGVGLCQIGAAVMADRGYNHQDILTHYFKGARLEKHYD